MGAKTFKKRLALSSWLMTHGFYFSARIFLPALWFSNPKSKI
jgi:hypothetical protein